MDTPGLKTFSEMLRELRARERAVIEQEIAINEFIVDQIKLSAKGGSTGLTADDSRSTNFMHRHD